MPNLGDEVSYNDEAYIVCGWDTERFEDELALMLVPKQAFLDRIDYSSATAAWARADEVELLKRATEEDLSMFLSTDETG